MTTAIQQTVMVNNKHYNADDLNENAQAQLVNLRFTDEQIQLLKSQQAVAETARASYTRELAKNLPEKVSPNKKKEVITIDGIKYSLNDFSEQGTAQLYNIQFAEQEISRLKNLQVVLRTARAQYGQALSEELVKLTPVTAQ